MNQITLFEIKGMHCASCKMLIEDILSDEKITIEKFDFDKSKQVGMLTTKTTMLPEKIMKLIANAGDYKVTLR